MSTQELEDAIRQLPYDDFVASPGGSMNTERICGTGRLKPIFVPVGSMKQDDVPMLILTRDDAPRYEPLCNARLLGLLVPRSCSSRQRQSGHSPPTKLGFKLIFLTSRVIEERFISTSQSLPTISEFVPIA